ncbi:MAG TPA: carboxypeptidase regulatory-like domain-containing protein, partial [Blastocatellia bacterium]
MQRAKYALVVLSVLASSVTARAQTFETVRGVVHDPQHRPIVGATVTIHAVSSAWTQTATTNSDGEFNFSNVTVGDYTVAATEQGFETVQQKITVLSDTSPVYHFALPVAGAKAEMTVQGAPEVGHMQTVTPTTLVSQAEIRVTPGADLTNSLSMITDYTPASYETHDMLHAYGGHQVSWLINGVEIPNTNIAANIAPAINPHDIDELEILRGSYDANYGDRTYGIFNVIPRSGFQYNKSCDFTITAGNFYQTDDDLGCGGHTERFAYFLDLNGNRSNYGLQPPIAQIFHDAENGFGGFASLMFNANSENQFRLVLSLRRDHYQIPYDPNPGSIGNQLLIAGGNTPSYALRDSETEPDGYAVFTWLRTFGSNMQLTLSPFYHYNGADYASSPTDFPVITTVNQTANYAGLQGSFSANFWKNNFQAGLYGFGQHQYNFFDTIYTDGSKNFPASSIGVNGGLVAEFIEDKFQPTSWLTLIAGLRQTEFRSTISENATDPRFGVDVRIPYLNWVLRGFYGYYYQAPPLVTATGSLVGIASTATTTFGFAPLRGERDTVSQFGIAIPYRGWTLDVDTYKTLAANWLDHNNIGESNLFWPITWDNALIRGWELTLRSPSIAHYGQLHLAYANQIAEAAAPVTGGLICTASNPTCYGALGVLAPVDHDRRNTLNLGFNATLPRQFFASTNVYYGSGFSNAYPGMPY